MNEERPAQGQRVESFDFSAWTVLALLVPAFKRAGFEKRSVVGTDDLVLEFSRRFGSRSGSLRNLHKVEQLWRALAAGRDQLPVAGKEIPTAAYYEAAAILREVALESDTSRIGRQQITWPQWSQGVLASLAEAQALSAAAGLPWVGDREVLLALLSRDENRASALLARAGIDKGAALAETEQRKHFEGKRPWAPAVGSLEMVGAAPTNPVVRFLMWPIRWGLKKTEGQNAGALMALENEASRQAVRMGHGRVLVEHVVLATTSVSHQLALSKIAEPEEMRGSGTVLERRRLSYPVLVHRIASGLASMPSAGVQEMTNGIGIPRVPTVSDDASAAFEGMRQAVAGGGAYAPALESFFDSPRGAAAIAALTGGEEGQAQ